MDEEKHKIDPHGYGKFLSEVIEESYCWLSDASWYNLQEWEQLELTTISTDFVNFIKPYLEEDSEFPEDLGFELYIITYPYWFDQHGSMDDVWESYEQWQRESFLSLAHELMVLTC